MNSATVIEKYAEGESLESSDALRSQADDVFSRVSYWAVLAGVFLLPLFALPYSGVSIPFGKSVWTAFFALAALFFWLLGRLKERTVYIPRSAILGGFALVLCVFLLSAVFAPSFDASFSGIVFEQGTFVSFLVAGVLLFVTTAVAATSRRVVYVLFALLFGMLLAALYQLVHLFTGADVLGVGLSAGAGSIVGGWNDLAIGLGLALVIVLFTADVLRPAGRVRWWLYAAAGVALFLLGVVNFDLVWYLLAVISLALLVFTVSPGPVSQTARALPGASLAVLLVSFTFMIAGDGISGWLNNAFDVRFFEVRPSWGASVEVLKPTLAEHPFVGGGLNQFDNQWLLHKPDGINETPFWNTDFIGGTSHVVTIAVVAGSLGVIAFLLFLAAIVAEGARHIFISYSRLTYYALLTSFVSALYLWATIVLYTPGMVVVALAFVCIGMVVALLVEAGRMHVYAIGQSGTRAGFITLMVLVAALLFVVAGVFNLTERTLALFYFEGAQRAFVQEGDIGRAETALARASSLVGHDVYYRGLVDVNNIQVVQVVSDENENVRAARAAFERELGQAIGAAEAAVRFDGSNYENWLARARVYAAIVPLGVEGAYDLARESYEKARELNPRSPRIPHLLAQLELAGGNIAGARELIGEALARKPDYTEARFTLAQLEIVSGNRSEAVRSLEEATLLAPNNAGLFFQLGLLRYAGGEYGEAVSVLQRAAELVPGYANAKYFLGLSLYEMGEREMALHEFKNIENTNPENEEIKRIIENLEAGRAPLAGISPPAPPPEEREEPPVDESEGDRGASGEPGVSPDDDE